MIQVEIRTKTPAQYFAGEIKNGYFPIEGKELWFVACSSCAGGGRKVSILSILEYKTGSKKHLIERLRSFAKREKYIINFKTIHT
jgi:hypothetical protein